MAKKPKFIAKNHCFTLTFAVLSQTAGDGALMDVVEK